MNDAMTALLDKSVSSLKYVAGAGLFWLVYVVFYSLMTDGFDRIIKHVITNSGHANISAYESLVFYGYMAGYILAILLSAASVGFAITRIFRERPLLLASLVLTVGFVWKLGTFFQIILEIRMPPGQDLKTFWYYVMEQHVFINVLEFVLIPCAPLLMTYLWLRWNQGRFDSRKVQLVNESRSPA